MKSLIKPPKLHPGDKIAAITLSWGGPGTFPYRFEIGKQRLEELFGLQVEPTKHALKSAEWIYHNPRARADDLMEAFEDPSIKGIIATLGGDDSIRLLPFVELDTIKNNPKVFMGYSDTTVSHFLCLRAGLSSFYGPDVMASFAENVAVHDYTIQGVRKTLFSNEVIGVIPPNKEGWTAELLDWADESHQNTARKLNPPTGWNFMGNCENTCTGRLIGGCIETLQFLNGTPLWPEPSFWDQSILFIEMSIEGMTPNALLWFMRNLAAQDILHRLSGILFSKPPGTHMTAKQFSEYDQALLKVFTEYEIPLIPIVSWMDFGHSAPMWPLPYGALCEINPLTKTVSILEKGVV